MADPIVDLAAEEDKWEDLVIFPYFSNCENICFLGKIPIKV